MREIARRTFSCPVYVEIPDIFCTCSAFSTDPICNYYASVVFFLFFFFFCLVRFSSHCPSSPPPFIPYDVKSSGMRSLSYSLTLLFFPPSLSPFIPYCLMCKIKSSGMRSLLYSTFDSLIFLQQICFRLSKRISSADRIY